LAADDLAGAVRILDEAIREARPTDPAGLAIQMRLLAGSARQRSRCRRKSWLSC
jgi:hypothetical protein